MIFITRKVLSLLNVHKPSCQFQQKNSMVWPQNKQLIGELMKRGRQKNLSIPQLFAVTVGN